MKKTNTIAVLAGIFVSGLCWAGVDLSFTELTKVQGKVEVKKGGGPTYKAVPANLQLAGGLKRLDSGDKVKTQLQSAAEMVLKETCLLTVKEKSLFEVPSVVGKAALAQMKANQGSFLFKVISGSDFKVQTADVVAGVKGTLFEVEIVDDLRSILTTPNLEIGLEGAGGTNVHVYEGEVELKHADTGKLRRIKAGESLAALGRKLFGLDSSLSDGFGPIRRFQPLKKLQERFGAVGRALQAIPANRLGLSRFNSMGLNMPVSIGKPAERFSGLLEGMQEGTRGKFAKFERIRNVLGQVSQKVQQVKQNIQDLKGEEFNPQFDSGKYPVLNRDLAVPEKRVEEVHVGDGLFISMMPDEGCPMMRLAPDQEGLVLQEGEGTFHIRDYTGEIDAYVTVRRENGVLVSRLDSTKGSLVARVPEEQKLVRIEPGRPVAMAIGPQGKPEMVAPRPQNPIPPEMIQKRFAVETDIEAQRAEHDRKVNEKRSAAAKNLLQRTGTGQKLGSLLGNFGNRDNSGNLSQPQQPPAGDGQNAVPDQSGQKEGQQNPPPLKNSGTQVKEQVKEKVKDRVRDKVRNLFKIGQ